MFNLILAGLAVLFSGFFLGKPNQLKRYLLGCGLFFLPFSFDYTFYEYNPVEHFAGWTNTISIRFSDVFFLLLYLLCPRLKRNASSAGLIYWFDRVILLFLLVASASIFYAIDRRMSGLTVLQLLRVTFLYYYVPSRFISWKTDGFHITKWLGLALVFQSLLAFLQAGTQDFYNVFRSGSRAGSTLFGDYIRSQGTAPQPNLFAEYLVIILLLLFSALLYGREINKKKIIWMVLIGVGGLLTAMSRGGWMSLVAGGVFLLYYYQCIRKLRNWIGFGLCVGLVIFLLPQTRQRLGGSDGGSAMDRYYLAKIAVEIIKANPVLGVGLNNYRMVVYKYVPDDYEWNFIFVVHTLVLLILAEMGLPGILALLLLFCRAIWVAWEPRRKSEYGFLTPAIAAACIAINVHNLFDIVWTSEIISSLFFFLLAMASPMARQTIPQPAAAARPAAQPAAAQTFANA